MAAIFPSLISGNLLELKQQIALLDPYASGYHLDVMDFHFVPNLTWGPLFINQIRNTTQKQLLIHLMVEYPENYIDQLDLFENDIISIHYESPSNKSIDSLFASIASRGLKTSIALKPDTSLDVLFSLQHPLDHVLLMSVEPGFSGQLFLPSTYQRLSELAALRKEEGLSFIIELDGGITAYLIPELLKRGADRFAVASALFMAPDPIAAIKELTSLS